MVVGGCHIVVWNSRQDHFRTLEDEVRGLDSSNFTAVAKMRRPRLTGVAVDVTAPGSLKLGP